MHLLLENVMKKLLEMWDGSYKAGTMLGDTNRKHRELYVIPKAAIAKMDATIAKSTKLIPSRMCGTLIAIFSRYRRTAEAHLFFMVTQGPILLKQHLLQVYFDHFLDLSELAKLMVGLSVDMVDQLGFLKDALRRWVDRFDS